MIADEVLSQFLEWHMTTALARAGAAYLWKTAAAHPIPRPETSQTLSAIFETSWTPPLTAEPPLLLEDARRFGFPDDHFRATFWGLRPDFKMDAGDVLILLEAKGHRPPAKTWTDPKERLYYRFLAEANIAKKGFFYIVPRSLEPVCSRCLSQHFQSHPQVQVGYILWEDLLSAIAPELLLVAVDEMVRVTDGLRGLRQWQLEQGLMSV